MIKSRKPWIWSIAGIAALAIYYFFIATSAAFNFADEGYLYYLSWAMGEGKVPFRDFELSSYPPSVFAIYTLAFKALGTSIDSGRILSALLMTVNVLLGYYLVRNLAGSRLALGAAIILGLVPGPWHKAYIGSLCCAALLLARRIQITNGVRDFIFFGCVIGLGLQLRLDAAFSAFVLLVATVRWSGSFSGMPIRLIWLTAAGALIMAPLLIYLGTYGVLDDYCGQVFRFLHVAAERNTAWYRLPPPTLAQLFTGGKETVFAWLYFGSFLVPVLLTVLTIRLYLKERAGDSLQFRIAMLVTIWVLMSIPQYALERPDSGHLYQRGFILIIGACFLVGKQGLSAAFDRRTAVTMSVPIVLILIVYTVYGLFVGAGGGLGYCAWGGKRIKLPNGMAFIESQQTNWGKILMEIAGRSRQTDLLAVLPYGPGLNFILELHPPGKKIHYFPNVIRNRKQDENTASDLVRADYIVLRPRIQLAPVAEAAFGCYAPATSAMVNREFRQVSGFVDPLLLVRMTNQAGEAVHVPPCRDEALPKLNKKR